MQLSFFLSWSLIMIPKRSCSLLTGYFLFKTIDMWNNDEYLAYTRLIHYELLDFLKRNKWSQLWNDSPQGGIRCPQRTKGRSDMWYLKRNYRYAKVNYECTTLSYPLNKITTVFFLFCYKLKLNHMSKFQRESSVKDFGKKTCHTSICHVENRLKTTLKKRGGGTNHTWFEYQKNICKESSKGDGSLIENAIVFVWMSASASVFIESPSFVFWTRADLVPFEFVSGPNHVWVFFINMLPFWHRDVYFEGLDEPC